MDTNEVEFINNEINRLMEIGAILYFRLFKIKERNIEGLVDYFNQNDKGIIEFLRWRKHQIRVNYKKSDYLTDL